MICAPFAGADEALDRALDAAGIGAAQDIAGLGAGIDARGIALRLIRGDLLVDAEAVPGALRGIYDALVERVGGIMRAFALPVGACLLLRLLFGARSAAARAPRLLCALCAATLLIERYLDARAEAANLIDALSRACGGIAPLVSALAACAGAPTAAGSLTPVAALLCDIVESIVHGWGLGLCAVAAAVALADGVAEEYGLHRLFALVRSLHRWLLVGVMFAFTSLLTVQGVMIRARDSAAMRAAQGILEGAIPIIGGELSGAAGALSVSASAIRSAVGITGLVVLARLCAGPMLGIGLNALSVKLAAAVFEPVADPLLSKLFARFGEALDMLLATCAACAALAAILMGGGIILIQNLTG